jgi:hypothetical protein
MELSEVLVVAQIDALLPSDGQEGFVGQTRFVAGAL